jgi:uncharacterized protein YvpB
MRHLLRLSVLLCLALVCSGLPPSVPVAASPHILTGFPLLRQKHRLTCESSAASMATRGSILEAQIMAVIPRNVNPNLGFRGNPDGDQGTKLIDYGVYAGPVHQALLRFGYQSDVLSYATNAQLRAYIDRGWPVVSWVSYHLWRVVPRLAWAGGVQFFLVPHEHAILLIGYDGQGVIGNDPYDASRVRYDWANFDRAWGYFGNMALAVQPCAVPGPISGLRTTRLTAQEISWTWQPAARAWGYQVQVTRHAHPDSVMYAGIIGGRRFTLGSISPGRIYDIAVRAVAVCGAMSDVSRLSARAPYLPTPTPTPTPSPTPTPVESTVQPSPTPTPRSTLTTTATITPAAATPTPKPTTKP